MAALRRCLLISLSLALAAFVSGCATTSVPVPVGFVPNAQEGMVFGRLEFVVDGRTMPPDTRFGLIKPEVNAYVLPLTDTTVLNRSESSRNQFRLNAPVSENGMFVAKLPVGRYYVERLGYYGTRSGYGNVTSWSTYHADRPKPFVMTFEVLPNKATYLGTVRNLVTMGRLTLSSQDYYFDLAIADERAEAEAFFLQRHPSLRESIRSSPVQTRPLKPGE